MVGPIKSFRDEFRFLSNFWPSEVVLDDIVYPTVEHAYQAAKTVITQERERIRLSATPGIAKRLGKIVTLRRDWDYVKEDMMEYLVIQKFSYHTDLRDKLLATGKREIIEGNTWGDTYWGVCNGKGQNKLGKILMAVREKLR